MRKSTGKKALAWMLAMAVSVSMLSAEGVRGKRVSAAGQKPDVGTVQQEHGQKGAGDADVVPAITFSKESGTYQEDFDLDISCADPDAVIYYTTDGSDPSDAANAARMACTGGSIRIRDRAGDPNVLAAIDPILFDSVNVQVSDDGQSYESTIEKPADEDVDKCTVIKAAAEYADGTCSEVVTNTYFIGEMADHIEGIRESCKAAGMDLSVMSISMDAEDLFDSAKGIYVKGDIYEQALADYLAENEELWDVEVGRRLAANYNQKGREWERETHIDYFESDGTETSCILQQDCGIRIQGNYSRSDYQKSFRLYARDDYGEKNFKYGFWDSAKDVAGDTIEKYKKIVLRNGGNCAFTTKFSDSYWQSLMKDINCDTQSARPCVVYLNGEYWGVYILQDDFCGAYIENKYSTADDVIDKDNVLIYKGDAEALQDQGGYKLDEGELPAGVTEENYYFQELESFMSTHDDLSEEADYQAFCELVDKDSALDYFATEVWINNKWDWPGKNWSMWKVRNVDKGNPYADGKWRFMLYDVEFGGISGESDAKENTVKNSRLLETGTAEIDDPNWDKPNVRCFALLMTNKSFRDAFIARLESFSEGMFEKENALKQAEKYRDMYQPILDQFFDRFPTEWNGEKRTADMAINGNGWDTYGTWANIVSFVKARAKNIPKISKWIRKQFGDAEPGTSPAPSVPPTASPSAAPLPTASAQEPAVTSTPPAAPPTPSVAPPTPPAATPGPKQSAVPPQKTDAGSPLPPSQRDIEIPLGDGSVKILHVNDMATKVEYIKYRVEGVTYLLKSDKSFSYMAENANHLKKKKSVVISDVVVAGGRKYKVTEIQEGAFRDLKKLQKAYLGENVKIIGKNAFKNCKKLKKLVISGKKLKKVGKNAFQGTAKGLQVSCPGEKKKAYNKLIKKSGSGAGTYQMKKIHFKQAAAVEPGAKARPGIIAQPGVKAQVDVKAQPGVKAPADVKAQPGAKAQANLKAQADEKTITMSSLQKKDGSFEEADANAVVTIGSAEELKLLSEYTNAGKRTKGVTFRQTADIDGTDMQMHGIGEASYRIEYDEELDGNYAVYGDEVFYGSYDGGGKQISNLNILVRKMDDASGIEQVMGMFNRTEDAHIRNVSLQSIHFLEEDSLEEFAGGEDDSIYMAGIAGHAVATEFTGCSNFADLSASGGSCEVAGICAASFGVKIEDCHNSGNITVSAEYARAMGLANEAAVGAKGCSNAGTIRATGDGSTGSAAGLFYTASGELEGCENTGEIVANDYASGIVASSFAKKMRRCSNRGNVTGRYAGGIVAEDWGAQILDSSNSGKINGTNAAGGIVGYAYWTVAAAVSNGGEVSSEQYAGGIAGDVYSLQVCSARNQGDVTGRFAGGAAGCAVQTTFASVWNHGKISADVAAGGIAGTDEKDNDEYGIEYKPGRFVSCVQLGTLAGKEYTGGIIGKSAGKDSIESCYYLEGSATQANGSLASVAADTVTADGWQDAAFIETLNQSLLLAGGNYALPMEYDAQEGIRLIPSLVIVPDEVNAKKAEILNDFTFRLEDAAGEETVTLSGQDGRYFATLSPGKKYKLYRVMPDGTEQMLGEEVSIEEGETIYAISLEAYCFCAYTDVSWETGSDGLLKYTGQNMYYKQYFTDVAEASLPPEPVKEGYEFGGWYSHAAVCNPELYAAYRTETLEHFEERYQECMDEWADDIDYQEEYDSAEEYADAEMMQIYGYATREELEANYEEYFESYRIDELCETQDFEGEEWVELKADSVYAKWLKQEEKPDPVPTASVTLPSQTPLQKPLPTPSGQAASVQPTPSPTPSGQAASVQATPSPAPAGEAPYPVLRNKEKYKDKLGHYVQKEGLIYQVDPGKKTAAVVGVSSKSLAKATIQSTVKTDGVKYKVTAIREKAFTGCMSLQKVTVKGNNLKKVDKKAFQGAAKKIKIVASAKIKKKFH